MSDKDGRPFVRDTTTRGVLSELEIATALVRKGRLVLRPLSSGLRYDVAVDNGDGTLSRIQCKTGVIRSGATEFNVSSADARRPNGVPYVGQVEAFGVFCPQNGKVYVVPIGSIAARASKGRLRLTPARNGQIRRVNPAKRFEL